MGLFTKGRPRGLSSADDKVPEDTNPLSCPSPQPPIPLPEMRMRVLSSLISPLRWVPSLYARCRATDDQFLTVGMDLHKVTILTFVLDPRSMLERMTDFMAHPDLIFG
jgi:hypothetical protein